jgi:NAD(P)H dehydrogenase (quinone)
MVLYDSRAGLVSELAQSVCAGVASVEGVELLDRVVDDADPVELLEIDALILGSPNWTGMTGKLKAWMDETGDLWESGDLVGKPGAAFTAGWSPHGGIEATLLQLFHLLVGHGMVFVGIPWSELMRRSGSYYGATAYAEVTEDDRQQAQALGQRVAEFAIRLKP